MIMNKSNRSPCDSSIIYPDNEDISETIGDLDNNMIYLSKESDNDKIPQERKTLKFPNIEIKNLRQSSKKKQRKVNTIQNIFSKKLNSLLVLKNSINLKSTKNYRKTKEMEFIHSKYLYNY